MPLQFERTHMLLIPSLRWVLLFDLPMGRFFVGCNVENSAYPEGTCAEAGAIAAMIAAGENKIEEVCVVAESPVPIAPCGGCRQKIAEFSSPDVQVVLADLKGETKRITIGELLPHAFSNSHLPGE